MPQCGLLVVGRCRARHGRVFPFRRRSHIQPATPTAGNRSLNSEAEDVFGSDLISEDVFGSNLISEDVFGSDMISCTSISNLNLL